MCALKEGALAMRHNSLCTENEINVVILNFDLRMKHMWYIR